MWGFEAGLMGFLQARLGVGLGLWRGGWDLQVDMENGKWEEKSMGWDWWGKG